MEEVRHKGSCLLVKDRCNGVIYTLSSTEKVARYNRLTDHRGISMKHETIRQQ